MLPETALALIPTYVLAFFRLAGLMLMAPLFGSTRIPRRVKLMFAAVAAMGAIGAVPPVAFPDSLAGLTLGIAGEMLFGIAMGTIASFTFIAAQWAGEMIGQQMGFNLSEVFDPQFGGGGTVVGDLLFMLTIIIFLVIGGHRILITAVHESFQTAPLLTLAITPSLFDAVIELFKAATVLTLRLAAPMFFTMLVVDLSMGCISRAMPQFNVMSAGLTLRAIIGMIILLAGVGLTSDALSASLTESLRQVRYLWPAGGQ
ncbi:MAG TPA: flagellar biosynthetic protein FliR [Tepidisphaeraceae bacterium]|jgi:flagellar biosynthetic protein FliR